MKMIRFDNALHKYEPVPSSENNSYLHLLTQQRAWRNPSRCLRILSGAFQCCL